MHSTFNGYVSLFESRAGFDMESHPELEEEFMNECGKCHTTCGQCHVSRPNAVKGGLVKNHRFMSRPSQTDNCMACHGSRVGEEYTGSRDGYGADVHYFQNSMDCVACHSGDEMHGDGTLHANRYDVPEMPRCEDCHTAVAEANAYHTEHWGDLSCQICHSQDYKNCNSCHVAGSGLEEPSYIEFKIGRNPRADVREYEFVTLRHIPITEDTFEPWGVDDLGEYDALPSWKYASPHNIKLWTARTDTTGGLSCNEACHMSPNVEGWFLRESDLEGMSEMERSANLPFIVPDGNPITGW